MISYATLENISLQSIFSAFMKSFEGFRIITETTFESFSEMLAEQKYDPSISVGAFDSETGELVSYVLNSYRDEAETTAYDILTGTIPLYRRRGIAREIFRRIKQLLLEKGVKIYTTEVLKRNSEALSLYLSVGFFVEKEVVTAVKTAAGSREVCEYKITMTI